MAPDDTIAKHFRLVPSHTTALKKLGLVAVRDLLYYFPARYDEGGGESAIHTLASGQSVTIYGTISKLGTRRSWKRKIPVGEATITDASGSIKVMWFHQPYLAKKFSEGQFVKAVGVAGGKDGKPYLANPHIEVADPSEIGLLSHDIPETTGKLFAVYPETRGLTSLWLRHAFERVFASDVLAHLEDPIPEDVRERYHLPSLSDALVWIHRPEKIAHAQSARKRFAFEEIFTIQVARAAERLANDSQASFPIQGGSAHVQRFLQAIEFPPTSAQSRAIEEILNDFGKSHPMARLLEGDVGAGKTLVAAATAYTVVNSRPPNRVSGTLQVAYMAPTEILATQHFQSFIEYFKHLPINIALMTGSGCKKFPSKVHKDGATDISRAQLLKWVENGEIAMLIGTHALIQKSVKFQHLAFAIVDEQHRFGTRQRKALVQRDSSATGGKISSARATTPLPHFLSMTATPIPRTLALTLYGDLDMSVLDELPPGRAKITTKLIKPKEREMAYDEIRRQLKAGRQAYVICPRINEPDPAKINALQAKSAKAEAKRLQKDIFPEYEVGLMHGAMKPSEKDAEMRRFEKNEVQILVATSVVEVGVNIPNATVILIEGAERFGLSQLHQLRGRVMRSAHPPYCFLLPETTSDISLKRLRALEKNDDGFKLAEADLETRGAGDLFGNKQWGVSDIGMEALKNVKLIQAAREEAQNLIASDPTLRNHPALRVRTEHIAHTLHAE
jgi:ATP-dependent DNA helicase RecG